MAYVRVEQRNAHLAGAVRLLTVEGRDGPVSKATLTAISNTRKGNADNRGEEATALQWTLWGKQAEAAAVYLVKGSHVNVVGRVQNNNYEREGETVYTMAFTAEEIDYLDSKAEGQALRAKQGPAAGVGAGEGHGHQQGAHHSAQSGTQGQPAGRRSKAKSASHRKTEDVPF